MKLYRTSRGFFVEENGLFVILPEVNWDHLVSRDDLYLHCQMALKKSNPSVLPNEDILAPVLNQEVWAAGVTYFRSRSARIEESRNAGGGDFYDRVYSADRPELFFKAVGTSVIGHLGSVRIRKDATWSVPEPELTLLISPSGKILGYTIGNDMSSRDIEGENPLYLPQAKVYDGSCALGPCIYLTETPISKDTRIDLKIIRRSDSVFSGSVLLTELKRDISVLVSYLYREKSFPAGCFLMTGTGIIPPDSFSLEIGDQTHITIDSIGTLINTVA